MERPSRGRLGERGLARAVREAPESTEAVREVIRDTFAADAKSGRVAYPGATWIVTAR